MDPQKHDPSPSPSRQRQWPQQVKLKPKTVPNPVEANLYAQRLNNSAAFCIEIGQYEPAIASLGKALRLSALHKDSEMKDSCLCSACTIEACISYSEKLPSSINNNILLSRTLSSGSRMKKNKRNKKQRLAPLPQPLFKSHFWNQEEQEEEDYEPSSSSSIYRRPIQVRPRSMLEGHNMGSTLFLIIVFNLALAHHLDAALASSHCSKDERCSKLKKTLKLYELVDSYYCRHYKNFRRCITSNNKDAEQQLPHRDRANTFEMIVCNNSSHIYHSLNNHVKEQDCLQRLISALMLAVDRRLTTGQQREDTNRQQQVEDDDQCDNDIDSSLRESDNLEGFFQTSSQLILRKQCADAA